LVQKFLCHAESAQIPSENAGISWFAHKYLRDSNLRGHRTVLAGILHRTSTATKRVPAEWGEEVEDWRLDIRRVIREVIDLWFAAKDEDRRWVPPAMSIVETGCCCYSGLVPRFQLACLATLLLCGCRQNLPVFDRTAGDCDANLV
jgi:hypothetical protein